MARGNVISYYILVTYLSRPRAMSETVVVCSAAVHRMHRCVVRRSIFQLLADHVQTRYYESYLTWQQVHREAALYMPHPSDGQNAFCDAWRWTFLRYVSILRWHRRSTRHSISSMAHTRSCDPPPRLPPSRLNATCTGSRGQCLAAAAAAAAAAETCLLTAGRHRVHATTGNSFL